MVNIKNLHQKIFIRVEKGLTIQIFHDKYRYKGGCHLISFQIGGFPLSMSIPPNGKFKTKS